MNRSAEFTIKVFPGEKLVQREKDCSMTDSLALFIVFIMISSMKSILPYCELEFNYAFMAAHVATSIGVSTICVLLTLRRKRRVWFMLWYLLNALLLFINSNYFEFFGKFIHLKNLYILLPEAMILAKNLAIPLDRMDIIFVVDLPLFLYLLREHRRNALDLKGSGTVIWIAATVTALAFVFLSTAPIHFGLKAVSQAEDSNLVYRYGFIGHNIIDLLKRSRGENADKVRYGQQITGSGTSGRHPNIVLIQIESLDANIVNYQYGGRYIAPFLHGLTTKSLYFPFTLCYRKLGGTSDCEIAINNGIEPLEDFPLIMDEDYRYPNSVAKVLKKGGYSTEAFHGSTGWYYKRLSAYAAMGYDNFYDPKGMGLAEKGWGIPDGEVMEYVQKHLEVGKRPFFISVITMTSHEPFNNFRHFVPDKRFDRVEPNLTGRYFASIAYADHAVGEFVTRMQRRFPDTYFFLYGDHTPYVINEGTFRRSVTRDAEQKEMVPLFIITPDGQRRYEHDAVASYLDIAPTILRAAGVPFSYRSLGADLLSATPLIQPIVYRGRQRNRSELFEEMTKANQAISVKPPGLDTSRIISSLSGLW